MHSHIKLMTLGLVTCITIQGAAEQAKKLHDYDQKVAAAAALSHPPAQQPQKATIALDGHKQTYSWYKGTYNVFGLKQEADKYDKNVFHIIKYGGDFKKQQAINQSIQTALEKDHCSAADARKRADFVRTLIPDTNKKLAVYTLLFSPFRFTYKHYKIVCVDDADVFAKFCKEMSQQENYETLEKLYAEYGEIIQFKGEGAFEK